MSVYTDLQALFSYKDLWTYQRANQLAANDAYLKAILGGYRAPNLEWVSVTDVRVECNTDTAHQTSVLFPGGDLRTVLEDVGSTHKYRLLKITAAAEFTSGTEDSGVRSGISEATNTWYAVYAVKSLIDASKFVLAADTTLPLVANVATLNSRYGTESWVYLGMIRNGDQVSATGDLLNFKMCGNKTLFANDSGLRLASVTANITVSWTAAAGTSGQVVPAHILHALVSGTRTSPAVDKSFIMDDGSGRVYAQVGSTGPVTAEVHVDPTKNLRVSSQAGTNVDLDISMRGFSDGVLGRGPNALI